MVIGGAGMVEREKEEGKRDRVEASE